MRGSHQSPRRALARSRDVSIAIDGSGGIVVGGSVDNGTDKDYLLARISGTGALDPSVWGPNQPDLGAARLTP